MTEEVERVKLVECDKRGKEEHVVVICLEIPELR